MSDDEKPSTVFNEATEAKPQSFAPAEMLTCGECLRANPPTRTNCLYCLATLPVTGKASQPRPASETVESTDLSRALSAEHPTEIGTLNAWYVVLATNQTSAIDDLSLAAIAKALNLQTSEVESALGMSGPVPLWRAATAEQSNILAEQLRGLGIGVNVLAEEALKLEVPARRVRALELTDEALVATLLRGGTTSTRWHELTLIVTGRLVVNRVESEERKRRGGSKPRDRRELFSDEPVLDFYASSDDIGCRVAAGSFDFSCLEERKAVTTFENFTTLVDLLKLRAPNAVVDESYRGLRAVLANVWPLVPETRKGDWRRSGVGKVDVSTVTTVDNEIQFNSYSRLRQRVRLIELEGDR